MAKRRAEQGKGTEDGHLVLPKGVTPTRLATFLRVFEAGSVRKVVQDDPRADPPLLRRQLKELAQHLDVDLYRTNGRAGRQPTEAANVLAGVLRELRAGFERVKAAKPAEGESFVIGAGDSLLQWLVIPVLPEVVSALEAAPPGSSQRSKVKSAGESSGIRFQTRAMSPDLEGVLSKEVDFALLRSDVAQKVDDARHSGLERWTLGPWAYSVFAPRSQAGRMKSVDEVRALRFAVVTDDRWAQETLERRIGGPLRVGLECETFPQAARAVRSGQFAAVLPSAARMDLPQAVQFQLPEGSGSELSLVSRASGTELDARARVRRMLGHALRARLGGHGP
jgi:hypothetical protein